MSEADSAPRAGDAKERQRREELFTEAAAVSPMIGVDTPEGRFAVSTGDDGVGRRLFVAQRRGEMKTLERALEILSGRGQLQPPGQRAFVDIGANIGTSCIAALVRHRFCRAIACEPHPENFRLLRANAAVNGVAARLEAHQVAVSETSGDLELLVSDTNSGEHRIAPPGGGGSANAAATITVPSTTLDALLGALPPRFPPPGLLWIDVQGHEPAVLRGAAQLLSSEVPVILELWPAGLASCGGVSPLVAALADTHGQVIDLRDRTDVETVPVEEIPAIAERLGDHITDLLLLPGAGAGATYP